MCPKKVQQAKMSNISNAGQVVCMSIPFSNWTKPCEYYNADGTTTIVTSFIPQSFPRITLPLSFQRPCDVFLEETQLEINHATGWTGTDPTYLEIEFRNLQSGKPYRFGFIRNIGFQQSNRVVVAQNVTPSTTFELHLHDFDTSGPGIGYETAYMVSGYINLRIEAI